MITEGLLTASTVPQCVKTATRCPTMSPCSNTHATSSRAYRYILIYIALPCLPAPTPTQPVPAPIGIY